MRVLFILLYASCLLHFPLFSTKLPDQINHLIQEKQYVFLGNVVRDANLSLDEWQKIAAEMHFRPLEESVKIARKIYAKDEHLGLKTHEFLQIALFIITESHRFLPKHTYLTPELTGLQDTIEHDPATGNTYIVLDRHPEAFLGQGNKKTVYKAILFDVNNPEIVARAEQKVAPPIEIEMYKRLQGAPGIISTRGILSRQENGETYTTFYFNLYDRGSLNAIVVNKEPLSLSEKATIAHSILLGLDSLHSRHLVHRDLHMSNFLIKIHKGKNKQRTIETVIADLGMTIDLQNAVGVQAQGSSLLCPPEGFFKDNMKGKDYFASDIYAVGCILHRIFHTKTPLWQRGYLRDSDKFSKKTMRQMLIKKLRDETHARYKALLSKEAKKKISVKQELELLILKMVQKEPEKRGSARQLLNEAARIKAKALHLEKAGKS